MARGPVLTPNERLLLDAFKASSIGLALEDLQGRPLFVNSALCSMLGFTEDELRSKHCAEFSPAEDAKKDGALFEKLRAGLIDHYELEKQFFRRDGSLIWGRLSISILGTGTSRRVVAMVEDLSEKKAAEEKLLQSEASLRTFGSRLIQAQEEERLRIARELHDDILQQVILVSVGLDHLRHNLPNSKDEVAKKISEAREHLSDISTDIHELSHRLHSAKLEYLGLVAAAASFCRDLSARQKVEIDFKSEGIPADLPEVASLSLYRVLQEALQNAIKHSGSQRIEVSLMRVSNEIHLNVRDWGKGFDPSTVRAGLGLVSMQERLILVNGAFSVQSIPQQGTTIDVRVPLQTGRAFHAATPEL